jgi:hypothetical protein
VVLLIPSSSYVTGGQDVVVLSLTEELRTLLSLSVQEMVQLGLLSMTIVEGSHRLIVNGGNVRVVLIVLLSVTVMRG